MKKRLLSILLALCMVTQFMPATALAEQAKAASNALASQEVSASADSGTDQSANQDAIDGQGSADSDGQTTDGQGAKTSTGNDADQAGVDPQADSSAVSAVSETGTPDAEPALTSNESAHNHRICGETSCTHSELADIKWEAWDKTDSLPSEEPGDTYYYLTEDVTLSSMWYVNSGFTINLCLNGHTITGPNGDSAITIAGGQLIITDCQGTGKITHKSGETGNGVSVNAGKFTMWGGTITGNTAGFGAGVANYALFNMYGGSITGNRVNDKAAFDGFGGGVYNVARLHISGAATVTGNTGKDGSADNVHLVKKARIHVDDAGMSGGAKVGVNGDDPASNPTLVEGSTDTTAFTSDNANYILQSNGNGGLRIASVHQHGICVKSDCGEEGHDNVEWAMWTSNNSLPKESGNYYLTADVTLSDCWMVESDIKLCLNGHTIAGAKGQDVVDVSNSGSLAITDCKDTGKITHAQDAAGGGITNGGTLSLWGGSICGNTVSSDGAGVRNTGSFTMAGGSIENNKTIGNGAGVRNSGTFVMIGGKITGNAITGSGHGAGVYNDGADFQVCGDVQITGNADKNNASSNVYLASGTSIAAIGEMGANASIGISLPSYEASPVVVSGVSDASATDRFFADDSLYTIVATGNGELRLSAHKHRICGENGCDKDDHGKVLAWLPVSSLDEIDSDGNYYLTGDVTRSSVWTCQYNVNLCLNGHSVTGVEGDYAINVKDGASLAITDCHSGDEEGEAGKITHAQGASGGAILNNGTLTLWAGQITGNSSDYGGAVYNMADSTFTMRGGVIADNTAHWGGGVRNDGAFTMAGGSIANNTADVAGGGVYNAGSFTIAGDVAVAENTVGAAPNNVYLAGENAINVKSGVSLSDKASIGITAEKPSSGPTVVTGTTNSKGFSYDDESYQLIANGKNGLKLTSEHIHAICGKTDCSEEGHGNETWTAWVDGSSLPKESGSYYLTSDVELSDTWRVESGVDIKLCLNGCIITGPSGKNTITVAKGGNLAVTDCQETVGQITHEKGQIGSGIGNYGTFTLWNGSITGNTAADQGQGGGVNNQGTFTMNGGSVTGNTANTQGGGVWNAKAFTMNGGSIAGNTAGNQGGGVYTSNQSYITEKAIFTMTGGSITGNNLTGSDATGGGVYASSTCYLSGDVEIRGNAQGGIIADGQVSGGTPNNVCANTPLNVAYAGMGASAKVGITYVKSAQNPTVVENTTNTAGFFSDNGSYTLVKNSDNTGLMLTSGHHHAICGQNGCTEDHESIEWKAWDSENSLPSEKGTYYLTKDVHLSDQWKVSADITLCLNGKTITSSYFGAAILVVHDTERGTYGNLAITDCGSGDSTGTIAHTAGKVGEGINNQNTLTIWGGQITGNSGNVGAGVYNGTDSTFSMYGGQITGNSGAGVYNSGTLVVGGDARITGNTENGAASNVYLINEKPIEVANGEKPLSAIAKIGITAQKPDSGDNVVNGSTDTSVFSSDNEWYELVKGENSGLKLSAATNVHVHKICGDNTCTDASHAKILWHAVSSLSDITADGDYYLTDNVNLSDTWTCSYNVNLCLNGNTITGASGKDAIAVAEGASLAVTDCHADAEAGKITHNAGGQGRGIYNNGTLALWRGAITNNVSNSIGGGVYSNGTFTMNGGSVTNNTGSYGGGVYCDGTFAMAGGAITSNTGTYRGGGVYNNGTMAMTGGSVTGNTAVYYGGGVYDEGTLKLSGTVSITDNTVGSGDQAPAGNVCLDRGKAVNVEDGAKLDTASRVGISAMNLASGTVAVVGSTDNRIFSSDSNGYAIEAEGSKLKLVSRNVTISDVKLLAVAGGTEMTGDSKVKAYDGQAVAVDLSGAKASFDVTGAAFTSTWQKKNGSDYVNIANNEAPKSAGEYRLVVSYGANGVSFGTVEIPFAITAKELKVKSLQVADKTYDGTPSATISGVELDGVVQGDSVSALTSEASFENKNAGTNKTVTAKVELTGDAAPNYTVAADVSGKGTINPKTLDVYAVTADKAYDGTTTADVWDIWVEGVVAGESDLVSLNADNMTANFKDATVGENKAVVIDGLLLTGNGKDNYALPASVMAVASIYKATGSGSVALEGWTYGDEANTPVPASSTNGTDGVTYQYKEKDASDETYSKNVPTAAGEYTVKATFPATDNYEAVTATADFIIAAKKLTIKDLAVEQKTYDGTTDAKIAGTPTLEGVVGTDDVKLVNGTPTFSAATAGQNVPVNFTKFSLEGEDEDNYALIQPTGITGAIAAKELTITGATVAEKTYDGTTDAKVTAVSFDGLVKDESLVFGLDYTVSDAKYDGANATGEGAATKVGFSVALKGTTVGKNYVLKDAKGSQDAKIAKAATSGYTVNDSSKPRERKACKLYVVSGGQVTVSVEKDDNKILDETPVYNNGELVYEIALGATKDQTASVKLKVTSANYADYEITVNIGVTEKKDVEISIDDATFTYNGQPQAQTNIKVQDDKVAVDTLVKTYVGIDGTSYEESTTPPKAVGTYLMMVEVPDSNTDYDGFGFCVFKIEPKMLTVSASAKSKTYNGTASAEASVSVEGVESGDDVKAEAIGASFDDKNVGTDKEVTVAFELVGKDAGNYTADAMLQAKANITAKELTIYPLKIAQKYYDGTNKASFSATPALVGVVSGEEVTLVNGVPTFASVSVGQNIPINFTDFTLGGADAGNNYKLTQPTGITGDISAYIPSSKEYTTTTKDLTNQDFVVTASSGWLVSETNTAEGTWSESLTRSADTGNSEGSLTFYVKNAKYGYISEAITKTYKIDKTAPTIKGAEDGNTYCSPVEITVTDVSLDKVTVDGEPVAPANEAMVLAADAPEVTFTVQPAEGVQTVVATDKAGNSTTLKLTVNNGHAALTHVDAKAATATADGNIEYWYCPDCGKYFADAAATKEIQQADTVVKKTDGSQAKEDDSSNGGEGQQDADGNAKSADGQASARTGDSNAFGLLLGSALLSGAVVTVAVASRKRKRVK